MTVFLALLLPLILLIGVVVVDVGNWWVHRKHLQTKVDAAAFAGGGAWGFPCGSDIDTNIEAQARLYVGEHMQADGSSFTGTTFNPQVGGTPGSQIHVVLNGLDWWDDDAGVTPADRTSPLNSSICQAKTLDVKATEANNSPLFGWLPFFPDIKRKARVEIQEVEGLTGLLPIAVRLPQPLSAAAVFYDESNGSILDVRYFREVCTPFSPGCILGMPPGLGQWTTEPSATDPSGTWASFNVAGSTGVVVATSFRPRCGAGTPPAVQPCLEASGWTGQPVDTFCRQASGAVKCYDTDGDGTAQTVRSGVHFIRGYGNADAGTGPPQLRTAYVDSPSFGCAPYFNSSPNACTVRLNVAVDVGALEGIYPNPPGPDIQGPLRASDVQVRYRLVRADGTSFCDYGASCDLQSGGGGGPTFTFSTQGNPVSPHLPIPANSRGNAVAIEVMLRNAVNHSNLNCTGSGFNPNCRWFYTGDGVFGTSVPPTDLEILAAPIQRSFMGDIDRTGPLRWLRLTVDQDDCDLTAFGDVIIGHDPVTGEDSASQPAGACREYVAEMGLSGGLARDQDEPPIALNLGSGASQRALIDCDPNLPNLKDEVVTGCQWPSYAANKFDTTPICPGTAGFFTVPKADPFAEWPPFKCVLTQTTAAANQIVQGFNERIFGKANNPTCPTENTAGYPPPAGSNPPWTKGRNYWHRDNNFIDDYTFAWDGTGIPAGTPKGNTLLSQDPRLVTLFFTTYDSFTGPGNEVYAVVGFGNFYVTGYGRTSNGGWQGGAPDDPCIDGNDGDLMNGNGNEPPPDIDFSRNTTWVWGHFVKDVVPSPFTTGGSGVLCNPEASFQPCVAVLVE
ncbi:MAG: pilus assembly protein TadG-related protein [Gaiellaceae bacterium]